MVNMFISLSNTQKHIVLVECYLLELCYFVSHVQTSDILYYEVLDIPLPELQWLKTLKVSFHHATKDEVSATLTYV